MKVSAEMWAKLFTDVSGIKVNVDFVKYDEQHEKVVASAIASTPTYDVFSLDLIWTAEFASKGFCVPLDAKIAGFKDDMPQPIMDAFVYDGKTWAMPFLANFQLFFYNVDMIRRAGFPGERPKTLEETVTMMKAMKSKGIVEYPWTDSWNQKEGLTCEYIWLTGAFGGETFDENGKPIFNEGAGLKALEFMVMLHKEGLVSPKSLTNDEPAARDDFIAGQAAFTSNWTFQYGVLDDPKVSKIVGQSKMGPLPVAKDVVGKYPDDTASVSGFKGAAILANSNVNVIDSGLISLFGRKVHLYDSKQLLIILHTSFTLGFVIWIMRGFYLTMPEELEDAARIDGLTRLQTVFRIVLPVYRPFCWYLSSRDLSFQA